MQRCSSRAVRSSGVQHICQGATPGMHLHSSTALQCWVLSATTEAHTENKFGLVPAQVSALHHGLHLRLLAAASNACGHLKKIRASMARQRKSTLPDRLPLSIWRKTAPAPNASSSPAATSGKGQALRRSAPLAALASPEPWDNPRQVLLRALLLLKHLAHASPSAQVTLYRSLALPLTWMFGPTKPSCNEHCCHAERARGR